MNISELSLFVAGVDLGGWLRDGKIYAVWHTNPTTNNIVLDKWPDTIVVGGTTYSLEKIVEGKTTERGTWQNACYC